MYVMPKCSLMLTLLIRNTMKANNEYFHQKSFDRAGKFVFRNVQTFYKIKPQISIPFQR